MRSDYKIGSVDPPLWDGSFLASTMLFSLNMWYAMGKKKQRMLELKSDLKCYETITETMKIVIMKNEEKTLYL